MNGGRHGKCRVAIFIFIKAMEKDKKIEQPTAQMQELLDDILSAEPTEFMFRGKRRKMGWLKNYTVRRFTHVTMKEKNEEKKAVKLCSILLLNDMWKIRTFYWAYWRWMYYVSDFNMVELLSIMDIAKKKIPSAASMLLTILTTGMSDLMMTMTKKERAAIPAAPHGEQPTR